MDDDTGVPVEIYVYDLTRGLARMLSGPILGKQLEGIWHTGVVVYGREYFFGSSGVESCRPGGTVLGDPDRQITLGETHIPYQVFLDYLITLKDTNFSGTTYDLFRHNCNHFSDEVGTFLCGSGIPKYILDLPQEVLGTPLGQAIQPFINGSGISVSNNSSGGGLFQQSNFQAQPRPAVPPQHTEQTTTHNETQNLQLSLEEQQIREEKAARREKKRRKKEKKRAKEESRRNRNSFCVDSSEPPSERSTQSPNPTQEASTSSNTKSKSNAKNPKTFHVSFVMTDVEAERDTPISVEEDEIDEEGSRPTSSSPRRSRDPLAEDEAEEEEERRKEQERKRHREQPIVFKDEIDLSEEMAKLAQHVSSRLTNEEIRCLEELRVYAIEGEGSWALSDDFLNFVGRVLQDGNIPSPGRVALLRALAALAVQRDDVILLLHQDRRDHVVMTYGADIDRLPLEEQDALALLVCNMFENLSTSEWLLYISEWSLGGGPNLSNIRVTTKVSVHALLSEIPTLQDRGSALLFNLAAKEKFMKTRRIRCILPLGTKSRVFDDIATELALAVLQFFQGTPAEENIWRSLRALLRFCQIAPAEVIPLVKMIGPSPDKFNGTSDRCDTVIEQLTAVLGSRSD